MSYSARQMDCITPWVASQHWGTGLWAFLHSACLSVAAGTATQRREARDRTLSVIGNLGDVIPCKTCRDHYAAMLAQHPPATFAQRGPLGLFEWSVVVHNEVNARLAQPTWTPERALRRWGIMGGASGGGDGGGSGPGSESACTPPPPAGRVPQAAIIQEYSRGGLMYSRAA
jgi:hypothetical protein